MFLFRTSEKELSDERVRKYEKEVLEREEEQKRKIDEEILGIRQEGIERREKMIRQDEQQHLETVSNAIENAKKAHEKYEEKVQKALSDFQADIDDTVEEKKTVGKRNVEEKKREVEEKRKILLKLTQSNSEAQKTLSELQQFLARARKTQTELQINLEAQNLKAHHEKIVAIREKSNQEDVKNAEKKLLLEKENKEKTESYVEKQLKLKDDSAANKKALTESLIWQNKHEQFQREALGLRRYFLIFQDEFLSFEHQNNSSKLVSYARNLLNSMNKFDLDGAGNFEKFEQLLKNGRAKVTELIGILQNSNDKDKDKSTKIMEELNEIMDEFNIRDSTHLQDTLALQLGQTFPQIKQDPDSESSENDLETVDSAGASEDIIFVASQIIEEESDE